MGSRQARRVLVRCHHSLAEPLASWAYGRHAQVTINLSVTPDSEDPTQSERAVTLARARLHVVEGPVPSADDAADMPPIRLRREFKGLTVADLHTEEVALLLPGQVCSALEHIEIGDLAAAERAEQRGACGQVLDH